MTPKTSLGRFKHDNIFLLPKEAMHEFHKGSSPHKYASFMNNQSALGPRVSGLVVQKFQNQISKNRDGEFQALDKDYTCTHP